MLAEQRSETDEMRSFSNVNFGQMQQVLSWILNMSGDACRPEKSLYILCIIPMGEPVNYTL